MFTTPRAPPLRLVSCAALDLIKALLRSNVGPLYREFKHYLCCNVHTTAREVWIPWVVVGVLLIVYCLLVRSRGPSWSPVLTFLAHSDSYMCVSTALVHTGYPGWGDCDFPYSCVDPHGGVHS